MNLPVQISVRDVEPRAAVEAAVKERASKLERYSEHLIACRVAVEAPHRSHKRGNAYHVRVDLTLPGEEIVVTHDSDHQGEHDVMVTIRDAFSAVERELKERSERRVADRRGDGPTA